MTIDKIKLWVSETKSILNISVQKYLKYSIRFLVNWKVNFDWFNYLTTTPKMDGFKDFNSGPLYLKVQYPYLSSNFDKDKILICLKQHYDWVTATFNEQYFSQNEVLLFRQQIGDQDQSDLMEIILNFNAAFVQEGEMSLVLKLNGEIQYTLTFTCIFDNDEKCFFIGGLQGGRQNITSTETIKRMTKQLWGLRPKHLMVQIISILAEYYLVTKLVAVSNQNHVFRMSRRKSKRARVKTNLDGFWEDFTDSRDNQNNYYFKPLANEIDLSQIQSKKRSQYKKRQLFLDELALQINSKLIKL